MSKVLIAVGANTPGTWGAPGETMRRAVVELAAAGIHPLTLSRLYDTSPLGGVRQPRYSNALVLAETALAPAQVLRGLKKIERAAGRRLGRVWGGPRPLDLDLIDHDRRVIGWPVRRRERGRLILPHPEMHRRPFVLIPLLDVVATWRHPALGMPARTQLLRMRRRRCDVVPVLVSRWPACQESG